MKNKDSFIHFQIKKKKYAYCEFVCKHIVYLLEQNPIYVWFPDVKIKCLNLLPTSLFISFFFNPGK